VVGASRPDNPAGYLEALAGAPSDYPLLLVSECCDPRTGLARRREQPPTVASIIAGAASDSTCTARWRARRRRRAKPRSS